MFKKLLPLLFGLLLMAASVNAGTSGRLDSLGISINDKLGIPRAGNDKIADSVRNIAINESITAVCADFPALEKVAYLLTATRKATLPSDYANFAWAIRISSETGDVFPMEPLHPSFWYGKRGEEAGAIKNYQSQAIPRNFWVHSDSSLQRAWFYPEPVFTDTVIFAYYAIDTFLNIDASATEMEEEYLEAVVALSCYKLLNISNRLIEANIYKVAYDVLKAEKGIRSGVSE